MFRCQNCNKYCHLENLYALNISRLFYFFKKAPVNMLTTCFMAFIMLLQCGEENNMYIFTTSAF